MVMLETLPRIVLDTNVLYAGLYLLRGELKQLALMTRERDKLRVQLSNAQLVIEVQKKLPRYWSNSSRFRSSRVLDGGHT
jgi:predicted nucleic acid-binding protein